MEKNRNLVFVGKINLDLYASSAEVKELVDTKDFADGGMGVSLGGASANVARAATTLSRVYGDFGSSKIVTRAGEPPEEQGYKTFGEHLLDQHVAAMTRELLAHESINVFDVAAGQMGPGIAKSMVSNFSGGRHIFKQMPVTVSEQFKAANDGFISHVNPVMAGQLAGAGLVFIDPARPHLSAIASDVCEQNGVTSIVDHGLKSWPTEPEHAGMLHDMLTKADILIVPGDAVVPGMEDGVKNSDKLFDLLQQKEYRARTIIMSDGTDPVRVAHNGRVSEIPVTPVENAINVSGAGDTRDGALMFFLSRGEDMETAVHKATEMASIRIQYPNNDWEHHVLEHVEGNPLFKDDVAEIRAAQSPDEPGLFDDIWAANDDGPIDPDVDQGIQHG